MMVRKVATCVAGMAVLGAGAPAMAASRATATEKGSLLVFPKVELRWQEIDGDWVLVQDTFIDISNDERRAVDVQMYFVNGDGAIDAFSRTCVGDPNTPCSFDGQCGDGIGKCDGGPLGGLDCQSNDDCYKFECVSSFPGDFCDGGSNDGGTCSDDADCNDDSRCDRPGGQCDRTHLGWNWVDVQIHLTADEPTYWSAASGYPKGTSPFTILDPGDPPGRPCTENTGERCLRGFIVAFAVSADNEPIRHNHLKGDAMLVSYDRPHGPGAWAYNAWAFSALWGTGNGDVYPSTADGCDDDYSDGIDLILDGDKCYDAAPSLLLYDFYAEGSWGLSRFLGTDPRGTTRPTEPDDCDPCWEVENDLTLLPMIIDLRQDHEGPTTTKAKFTIWNMNEVKKTGTVRCITCWDQEILRNYDPSNHFLVDNLQTDKGKARIDGVRSPPVCSDNSKPAPLLGVASTGFFRQQALNTHRIGVRSGLNLIGVGAQVGAGTEFDPVDSAGVIKVDLSSADIPEATAPGRMRHGKFGDTSKYRSSNR